MAPRYRLTPEVLEGIAPLAKLPADAVRQLATELGQLTVKLAIEDDIVGVIEASTATKAKPSEEREQIAEAITGLHLVRSSTRKKLDEIIADIVDAFEGSQKLSGNADGLAEKLETILKVEPLRASTKAWTLIDDHDTIYLASRIITDIRPVFDEDLGQPLRASLLVHTIKIMVRTDGRTKPIYVVADNSDLVELQENIQRALDKGAALGAMIRNTPEHWFGTSLGEDSENGKD